MAKKKYYAVAVGKETGIFETWLECEEMTEGYPGAKFKSFDSEQAALLYIESFNSEDNDVIEAEIDYELLVKKDIEEGRVVAFTDGSYNGKTKESGYGIYIMAGGIDPVEISDKVFSKKFISTNNIAPEVFAVLEALKWAVSNEYDKVTIYHDLELVGNWANGTNRANGELGKLFLSELHGKYSTILDIKFVWVKGHNGNEYNEKADRLAANAIKDRKPVGKYGANSFYGKGVSEKQVLEIVNLLKEKDDMKFTESQVPGGNKFQFIKGDDKLTVTFFKKNEATWLQGKVNSLFSEFLSFYTENIQMFEMVRAYSDTYKETLKIVEIETFIESLSLPNDYPVAAKTLLQQSFIMRNLSRKEIDYSHYTSPAYRALEGHLKYLCSKAGYPVNRTNLGGQFNQNPDGSGTKILSNLTLKNHELSSTIEKIYNLIYSKRHPVSHFGDILVNGFEDTLLIPDLSEAHARIDEVFDLIVFV